ncbi:F-box/LRR-repeat protein [Hordeum vulgare]|nr:F-box/LRR-repeat protein [Hordeum vulgare]
MAMSCLGGDRLSALPDTALLRVLSHLSSKEVARACALSRRWRHLSAAVPVVDLVDPRTETGRRGGDLAVCFDMLVTSVIISKDPTTPIRALRLVALDAPVHLLDQWVRIASSSGAEEVDVDLRYPYLSRRKLCPYGSKKASADFDAVERGQYAKTPPQLFRCGTLLRLRLANWTLDLPSGFAVAASLDTLCLKRIMATNGVIRELLSGCPRLADLTLEECPGVKKITVPSECLRSFAMLCCHKATRVKLRTRRLRSLRYKGGLPRDNWLVYLEGYEEVAAVTIDICEDLTTKSPKEVAHLMKLIGRGLRELRQLVLKGFMAADHAVLSIAVLLVNARNLEVLSLFPAVPPKPMEKKTFVHSDEEEEPENCAIVEETVDYEWTNKNLRRMNIPCLGHSLRRISIEMYSGSAFDKMLAEFLLNKAATLEEFSVTLSAQVSAQKEEIAMEFKSWLYNPSATVTCE